MLEVFVFFFHRNFNVVLFFSFEETICNLFSAESASLLDDEAEVSDLKYLI